MLDAVELDRRKNIYIANIVKCRPPKNRDPKPEEQEQCIGWLREQVRLIRPKVIVCLGRIAAAKIIKPDIKITKEHGMWFEKGGILMMPMLHPAALLRDPRKKPEAFQDFITLREKLREIVDTTYHNSGVDNYRIKDGVCDVSLTFYMDSLHYHGGKIRKKSDKIRMSLRKVIKKPTDLGFSISAVSCPSCGASFDAAKVRPARTAEMPIPSRKMTGSSRISGSERLRRKLYENEKTWQQLDCLS